tara:strand:- start:1375 stop:1902 length:528 start_codon:yes stop_codon:yes gene_type:complete
MKILVVSTCQEKLSEEEFVKPIIKIVGKCDTRHYLEQIDYNQYDKIIICGTALHDNEFINEKDNFVWLKDFTKPVLGICSGMQMIGLIFGAELVQKQEIGLVEVVTKIENKLFKGIFSAYNLHGNALNLGTTNSFQILAESQQSVQAIKHKTKEIYGIIFHPEVRKEDIVKNFIV